MPVKVRLFVSVLVLAGLLVACGSGAFDPSAPDTSAPAEEVVDDAEAAATETADDDDAADDASQGDEELETADDGSQIHRLAEPTEVSLGYLAAGMQTFVVNVMTSQGFDAEHNLVLDLTDFLSPPALHTAIAEKAVDVGFGGIVQMTAARGQGRGIVLTNVIASPDNLILSPQGSGVESLSDLRDGTLGIFSGCQGQFAQMTQALAEANHGFDLASETDCVEAPDPALVELLDRGELDGALVSGVQAVRSLLSQDYTIVTDSAEEWGTTFGSLPGHVMVSTSDEFLEENEEVMVALNSAITRSLNYIAETPSAWAEFADALEIDHPDAADMLEDHLGPRLLRVWDEAQVDAQMDLLDLLIDLAPEGTFVEEVPEGLFRVDLQPGRWAGNA